MRSTTDRGYGAAHQAERRSWERELARVGVVECHARVCLMPDREIYDGDPWDLGHTEDRTGWTGPEHPKCNRTEPQLRGQAEPACWDLLDDDE